ncbi:MAG TPA: nuclear transport factor 2 family protein [Candidatus Binatia bacterium]|nr:nuclear transport factor 2 family protein [Candidatus Binatia bacterium]
MSDVANPREADRQFFTALISADVAALDRLLADDFLLIDVMSGSEVTKASLLAVIESGQLRFEAIEPVESLVRLYQTTAVITGRTQMRGRFAEQPFTVSSRYTHVFVEQQGQWRLVTAQGTQVSAPPGQTAA